MRPTRATILTITIATTVTTTGTISGRRERA